MQNNQIWLKPKPSHIDENFEDFLKYLEANQNVSGDALYTESVRLLKERVDLLVEERMARPVYRQTKDVDELKRDVRLLGAWLLAVKDVNVEDRKLVLLTMTNSVLQMCIQYTQSVALQENNYAYRCIPKLIELALSIPTHGMPSKIPFGWKEMVTLPGIDMFLVTYLKIELGNTMTSFFDGNGAMVTEKGTLALTSYSKHQYEKLKLNKNSATTEFLPEYGVSITSDKDIYIKESQKDDISVIERYINDVALEQNKKKEAEIKRLSNYSDGEIVAVEVVSSTFNKVMLRTIDPAYNVMSGPLFFDGNLKIASIYPMEKWAAVLHPGDRFNAKIDTDHKHFSVQQAFIDYINDNTDIDSIYDAHFRRVPGGWRSLSEFWTTAGFMVYVDLEKIDDSELSDDDHVVVAIDSRGTGQYRGCLYGSIDGLDVETHNIDCDKVCIEMLKEFIHLQSDIKISKVTQTTTNSMTKGLLKEYLYTWNVLQSRESNPMLRFRMLSIMRVLCTMAGFGQEEHYSTYLSKYLKMLIGFAQSDENESSAIMSLPVPEDLEGEAIISNGEDILKILKCFGKDYEDSSEILEPYIKGDNELLGRIASLVQSYDRLTGLLENRTLRGIKKQILNHLSVVTNGDTTLELSSEIEGIFGEEDDMKEFKCSFFEAPTTAQEQRQFYTIFKGICAMMNNRGGVLYLGVNDRGIPIGIKNDLAILAKKNQRVAPTIDAYMIHISRLGEDWFGEKYWKYVTLKPITEHNVVSINVEPYPYDLVCLKDGTTYLRKNNSSAPILNEDTKEDIRRRRRENLRKTDDKIIVLQDAIQKQQKVRLIGYKSNNSAQIANRTIEPYYLDGDGYVHGYDIEKKGVRVFRISRADRIVKMEESWTNKEKHIVLKVDPFHMTNSNGAQEIRIRLKLKLAAKNAIEEAYPKLADSVKQVNGTTWTIDTFAYDLIPIMIFYISHAPDIEILEATGLKEKIHEYVTKNLL